jgi:phenylacetate-CoA ligase
MIFQYNPLDYYIETLESGELAFTICRSSGAAPKIRYNLKDLGGTYTLRGLTRRLAELGVEAEPMPGRIGHFPVVFVFGRSDLSVAFYGAKVFPSDMESVLLEHPVLSRAIGSFQFSSYEDERVDRRLAVDLELAPGSVSDSVEIEPGRLAVVLYEGLARANQDFREVSRMFRPEAIEVRIHPHGTGPFAGADVRLKLNYVKRS